MHALSLRRIHWRTSTERTIMCMCLLEPLILLDMCLSAFSLVVRIVSSQLIDPISNIGRRILFCLVLIFLFECVCCIWQSRPICVKASKWKYMWPWISLCFSQNSISNKTTRMTSAVEQTRPRLSAGRQWWGDNYLSLMAPVLSNTRIHQSGRTNVCAGPRSNTDGLN